MSDLQTRAANFLRWLYDDQAGYIEIVAGENAAADPKKITLDMSSRRWCYYDPERPDLITSAASYAELLAQSHGNVYVGARLYSKKARDTNSRSEGETKPSRIIFVDDAPATPELPYSASIRTSANSRHAYYKCDRHITKDDARRAAAALGGDPSGVDFTQLVRVPGTVNTKNGGRFTVETESATSTVYKLDTLRAAWPAVTPKATGVISDLNMPAVEHHLANMDALLSCARSQLIKPITQAGRILAGEMLAFPVKGRMDDSRSMNCFVLGNGFYIRGYMDDEIAAVMFYHYRKWDVEADKGTEWCKADISRSIGQMHADRLNVTQTPTRYGKAIAGQPIISTPARTRARSDRPTLFDPAMLFACYQAEPALCELKRKARAAHIGISPATLDRLERNLKELGLIQIEASKGLSGRVKLLVGVINIGVISIEAAESTETPPAHAGSGETADRTPQCKGETHPPPEAPRPAPPLRDIARLFFSIANDPNTGEVWDRHTFARFKGFAARQGTYSDVRLVQVFRNEQARARYAKQDAKLEAQAREMRLNVLQRKSRAAAGLAEKYSKSGDKRAPIWRNIAGIYAAEEERRAPTDTEPTTRELWAEVDQAALEQARKEMRKPTARLAGQKRSAACVPPNPAPAGATGMYERLQQLKAQRESAVQ